jgi:hypothetical protein
MATVIDELGSAGTWRPTSDLTPDERKKALGCVPGEAAKQKK